MTRDDSTPDRPALEMPASTSRIGRAVDEELAFHLDERVRELVASGLDRDAAHARAVGEFGDLDSARRELRRIDELAARRSWLAESLADLAVDVRRTLRVLARRPGYALVAVLTLALGIGANSTMFALVDRLLLSPPPYIRDAKDVVRLRFDEAQEQSGRIIWLGSSYDYYRNLTQTRLGFDVAGSTPLAMALRIGAGSRPATIVAITPGYFALLGTRPAFGRFPTDGDGADERSMVISHSFWSRELGRAEDVVGRDIVLGGESFRVIGIAPRGFTGDRIDPVDGWIPLGPTTPALPDGWRDAPYDRRLSLIARPHRDVSRDAVIAEATRQYRATRAGTPLADSTAHVRLLGLAPGRNSDGTVTPESRVALWLQGVSVLVLLIAVANVANLLLLRAIERRRETAVRVALGIGRTRLVRHVLLESVLLGGVAAIVAAALARWAGPVLWRLLVPAGVEASATPWRDAAVVGALAVSSAIAMAIVPALLQLRTPTHDALRSGSRGVSARATRTGDLLVVVQVACAVVLVVGAGLFVRSLLRVADLDLGFEVDRVVVVRVDQSLVRDTAAVGRFMQETEDRLRSLPGVVQTTRSLTAPYRPSMTLPVFLPGRAELPGVGEHALGYPSFFAVTPEFFATMGLEILRGRGFETADAPTAPLVTMVDATMARTFWPNGNALGQCVRIGADTAPCRTVVGVVQDTRRTLAGSNHALRYYVPLPQLPSARTERYVFVRTARSPASMLASIRAAATSAQSNALVDVSPMSQLLEFQTRSWRLGRAVFVAFGVLATVVATIGLYGIIAFGVAQRRRELGIRIALGAPRSSVLGMVMRGAGARMVVGCAVGGMGAFALGRRLRDLLFQTSPTDTAVFGAALLVVTLATAVACMIPAWRATRVDPTVSLRAD